MPTLGINQRLTLNQDHIKGFIWEHSCGLIQIYNIHGVKDERAWDLIYHIIMLDPVTTSHYSQFQLMRLYRRSRYSPVREWWAAFSSYCGQTFDKTCYQMNNWRWDNPRALGNHVDFTKPQISSSGNVKCTGKHFALYSSDNPRAKIEPPSCRPYKPGDCLAVELLNLE